MTGMKMKRNFLILFITFLAFPASSARAVEVHTLSNGLKVFLVEEHKAPVVTIQVWYKVGSRNEITGKTGLAHLAEHMMFKGTEAHGKGEFSRLVAVAGGTENAFTGWDYTAYFENLSADQINLSLELESDRMRNLIYNPGEFDLERNVVKEERRLRTEDDPQSLVVENLFAMAFIVHPYHSPIIGWMTDLNRLTRDDAFTFYRKYYNPNNATLVIVGDIDPKSLLPRIKETFGAISAGDTVPPIGITEPEQRGERRFVVEKEAQLPFVFAGFHVPTYNDADTYALSVLETVLSSGKSSRLYRDLVYEKRLALSVGGSYDGLSADPSLFYFYGVPLPGQTIGDLEAAIFDEVEQLKKEPVSDKELTKAKNQIEASFVFGLDSNFYRAMQIGRAETVGAGYSYYESFVDNIQKVTAEDVRRVAEKYLVKENRTVGILNPLPPRAPSQSHP